MNSSDHLSPTPDNDLTIADYEEVLADHLRLVRKLDILINGKNAAQQASLCDIVKQIRDAKATTITIPLTPPRALLISMAMRLRHDFGLDKLDLGGFGASGMTAREREVMLTEMAQLYEEVVGLGYYKWDHSRDGFYHRMGEGQGASWKEANP